MLPSARPPPRRRRPFTTGTRAALIGATLLVCFVFVFPRALGLALSMHDVADAHARASRASVFLAAACAATLALA